jgi:hypothetical protein
VLVEVVEVFVPVEVVVRGRVVVVEVGGWSLRCF